MASLLLCSADAKQALSGISLAKYVQSSPALMRILKPVANAYANATGHRQMGLRYDDLLIEESDRVQKALSRLPEKEAYDRAFRLRQASHLSVIHRELPKEQWLPASEVSLHIGRENRVKRVLKNEATNVVVQ